MRGQRVQLCLSKRAPESDLPAGQIAGMNCCSQLVPFPPAFMRFTIVMRRAGAFLVHSLLLIFAAPVFAAAEGQAAHTLMKDRVSDRLERASVQLERTLDSLRKDNFATARTALKGYSGELRQLGIEIEKLPMDQSESEFVSGLLDGLDLQIGRLDVVKANVQPNMRPALLDAIKQLRRTMQTLIQKWGRIVSK